MSNRVSIPIAADVSSLISGMERFNAALRKTGQEAKKLSEVDFSFPEMGEFVETLGQAQRKFDEIVKFGKGETADKLRRDVASGKYSDVPGWWSHVTTHDPRLQDPRLRERHIANVGGRIFSGTPFSPQGGGDEGGGMLPPFISGGAGAIMRWALPVLGLAKVGSMAMEGVSSATDEAVETSILRRQTGAIAGDFEEFRDNLRKAGEGLGVTFVETVKLARAFSHASGATNQAAIFKGTSDAIGFARALGLDPSQTVGRFGRAQWLQVGGKNADAKELADMFANAISAGGMFAKADEVMDAITNWVATSERVMVESPNVQGYAALQAAMNASNKPGLRGEAGAALLGQMDAALRSGGAAGEAGRNFLYNIYAGVGKRDPFQVQYAMEGGAFERIGEGGPMLYQAVFDRLKQQYGGDDHMRWSAAGNLLGISMRQAEALEGIKEADLTESDKTAERLGYDVKGMDIGKRINLAFLGKMSPDELKQYRDRMLTERGGEMSDKHKAAITAAGDDPAKLRDALLDVTAFMAPEKDIGRRSLDATIEIKNQVTRLADGVLEYITSLKEGVGGLGKIVNAVSDAGGKKGIETYGEMAMLSSGMETIPPGAIPGMYPNTGMVGTVTGKVIMETLAGKPVGEIPIAGELRQPGSFRP